MDVDVDVVGPDEVLVSVVASGVCHADRTMHLGAQPLALPLIPGHEAAGIVEAVGSAKLGSSRFPIDIPLYCQLYLQGRLMLDELISEVIAAPTSTAPSTALTALAASSGSHDVASGSPVRQAGPGHWRGRAIGPAHRRRGRARGAERSRRPKLGVNGPRRMRLGVVPHG